MAKRVVSIAETVKIRDLLHDSLTKTTDYDKKGQAIWIYSPGISDGTIARQVSETLTNQHVAHIRNQLFGPVNGRVPKPAPKLQKGLEERVSRLEQLVHHLCVGLGVDPG